jgi:GTP-binding protein EngB required for normal cell division
VAIRQRGGGRRGGKSGGGAVQLCSGCGVEILRGGGGGGKQQRQQQLKVVGGEDALADQQRSKKQARKARYAEIVGRDAAATVLCERCQALQQGNVWKAYDALRDVDATVFTSQLRHIVSRRRFGLCITVVDAKDPEFTAVRGLRRAIGSTPCILVINKVDLLPRMSERDMRFVRARVEGRGVRTIDAYAVSASTGRGLAELAEGLLQHLGGRDVFVVGSANVGKSTLVKSLSHLFAKTLWMRGRDKRVSQRKQAVGNLRVTASHLPGTTLQAVRVPCFPSDRHALWDTPGIINESALDYSLFPSHLLEPLAYPEPILIPNEEDGTKVQVKAGESVLIEAAWIARRLDDPDVAPFTLARLDIVECNERRPVEVLAFVPCSLKIRVVPTEEAPTDATIPREYVQAVQERIGESGNFDLACSRPLDIYEGDGGSAAMRDGIVKFDALRDANPSSGWIRRDIVFASLGWIMLNHPTSFQVRPMCVRGSLWAKRQSLYPSNLEDTLMEDESSPARDQVLSFLEDDQDSAELEMLKRRLKIAAEEGRHLSNARR